MRVTAGVFGACLLILGTYSANAQNVEYKETITIPGGVKVCSAVVPGNWRNDLPVPRAWTQATCDAWATAIGAGNGHNYACLSDTGIKYDFQGGTWNTCGW
jgi:hypothetical protein